MQSRRTLTRQSVDGKTSKVERRYFRGCRLGANLIRALANTSEQPHDPSGPVLLTGDRSQWSNRRSNLAPDKKVVWIWLTGDASDSRNDRTLRGYQSNGQLRSRNVSNKRYRWSTHLSQSTLPNPLSDSIVDCAESTLLASSRGSNAE